MQFLPFRCEGGLSWLWLEQCLFGKRSRHNVEQPEKGTRCPIKSGGHFIKLAILQQEKDSVEKQLQIFFILSHAYLNTAVKNGVFIAKQLLQYRT